MLVIVGLAGAVVWIFGRTSDQTGISLVDYEAVVLVSPKAVGERPFRVPVENRQMYVGEAYDLYDLKEQRNAMEYLAGYFWGFQKIAGTADKLMLVKDGFFGKTYQFRVAMEESADWHDNETYIVLNGSYEQKAVYKYPVSELKKFFWWGRKVIVYPGFFVEDGGQKIEANGVIWAGRVVL